MIYQLDNAVHARFATKFAISLQVVSLHVKAFSQQFGKPTKKKTDLVVCYLHCASSNSSRRDNRLRTGVNGESFASCRYETEFSSLLALWRRLAWELATATYIHTYIHTYILYLSCRSVKKEAAKELMCRGDGCPKRKSLHVTCSRPRQNVKIGIFAS